MKPEKRLLLIDNSVGDFYQAAGRIPARGFSMPCEVFNPTQGGAFPEASRYTHVLATGCTRSVCAPEPWTLRLQSFFAEALERNIALLAICYSHQLLARTVAGERYIRRRAAPELGWVEQEVLLDDPLFGRRGDRLWGFVSHFDEVCDTLPPDKAAVVLRSAQCGVEAFRVAGRNAWGVQGHFEDSIESGREMLRQMCAAAPALEGLILGGEAPRDSGFWTVLLERFQSISAE